MLQVLCNDHIRAAGVLGDFYQYDILAMSWIRLDVNGSAPSGRYGFGFSALGSRLFMLGGSDGQGDTHN